MLKNLRQVVTILETILKVNVYFSFLSKRESCYKSTFFYYYQTETQNRSILNSQDQSFGSKNDDSAEDNAMYLQFPNYSKVMRSCNIKQTSQAFLFNIRNYLPEVINIIPEVIILHYWGWIIPILNKKCHGIFVLLCAINSKQDLGR